MRDDYLIVVLSAGLHLRFRLIDSPITDLWLERMSARTQYPLDHPDRFYGFDNSEQEISRAVESVQSCIRTINLHEVIIDREFNSVNDQDGLNYLHNIFERYHGLLDRQDHQYWKHAPLPVRKALAELNLAVHRCETAAGRNHPRFVCTWFGLPKTKTIAPELIQHYGTINPAFGTVYLNYVEIGKTLEDLAQDNDIYIDDNAFKPFSHYSADFAVRFADVDQPEIDSKLRVMRAYYDKNKTFFSERGYHSFESPELLPYRLPVAQISTKIPAPQLIDLIQQQQYITQVYIE